MKSISAWAVILALLIFVASVFAGYRYAYGETALALSENLRGSLSPLREMSSFPLFLVIFLNNSLKALMLIVLGIIPFIFAAGFLTINGVILGVVLNHSLATRGPGFTLVGLLPHGILELSAVIIAAALGLQIGAAFLAYLGGKKGRLGQAYKSSLKFYVKFVVPALFLAALIETMVARFVLPRL